jgi:hypothetical protein
MPVRGLSVAVVGRAASLAGSGNGAEIDAADVVVRVNWALPLEGAPEDIGTRTDLVYYCGGCHGQRDAAKTHGVAAMPVDKALRSRIARYPKLVRATTGVVAVFDALRSGAREVRAFGFDFYRSGYVSPAPPWDGKKVATWRHDAAEDRRILQALWRRDKRFRPDATLAAALRTAR